MRRPRHNRMLERYSRPLPSTSRCSTDGCWSSAAGVRANTASYASKGFVLSLMREPVRTGLTASCEEFPFSGQVRPSAAALARRAGPVLAALRAAGPAAAHDEGPATREQKFSRSPDLTLDLYGADCSGRSGGVINARYTCSAVTRSAHAPSINA